MMLARLAVSRSVIAALQASAVKQSRSSGMTLLIFGGLVVLVLIASCLFVLITRLRSKPAPAALPPTTITTAAAGAAGAGEPVLPDLDDVSHRLAAITGVKETYRAIAREAMGVVQSQAAAVVLCRGEHFAVAYETSAGFIVADKLNGGALARVAETGLPMSQVTADESSIGHLPAALLAVPIVDAGTVPAVLVVVREAERPFTAADRDSLSSLATAAAVALHSAELEAAKVQDSLIDALTGAGTRRRLDDELAGILGETGAKPTTLAMVDIDHFKAVNDQYGPEVGDFMIAKVASILHEGMRPGDRVYRYSGEEFCVVLLETTLEEAVEVAERVRVLIEVTRFGADDGQPLRATASFGVATQFGDVPAKLIGAAEAALYEAKNGGRNRVVAGRA